MSDARIQYRILDADGLCVVSVDAPKQFAEQEISHYAMQYSQDGPIKVQRKENRKWVDDLAFKSQTATK